eukprot:TRINITY_DN4945_c2_g2_i1.p1 TRINITY_DN4945_c2_g2~~TRINITY_DN4945_c2_g2_i1.p1  ORF type:complete len:1326 (+),score=557.14 TRINITY_DN4945_c2_g2_i1:81-3980(+)
MAMHGRRMRLRRLYEGEDTAAAGAWPYHTPAAAVPSPPQADAQQGRGRSTVGHAQQGAPTDLSPDYLPGPRNPSIAEGQQLPPHFVPADQMGGGKVVEARIASLEALLRRSEDNFMRADARARQQETIVAALMQRVKDLEAHSATRDGASRRAALDGERLGAKLDQMEQALLRRVDESQQQWQGQLQVVEEHARRMAQQAREGAHQSAAQALQELGASLRAHSAAEVEALSGKLRTQQDAASAQSLRLEEALSQLGGALQRHQQEAEEARRKAQEHSQATEAALRLLRDTHADTAQQLRQGFEAALLRERQQRERDAADRAKAEAAQRTQMVQQCTDKVAAELGKELRRAEGFAETAAQRMDAIEELLKAEIRSRMELGAAGERSQEELRRVERAALANYSTLESALSARVADLSQALASQQAAARDAAQAMHDSLAESAAQLVDRLRQETAEARRSLAGRVESLEQGLTDAAQRDTSLQYRATDAERLLEELRGMQEREGQELRGMVQRAENRWEEELRGAQNQTAEWVQQQVTATSREAAAREMHIKEFCLGEGAKLSDALVAQQRDSDRALTEHKRAALRAHQELSAELRTIEDKIAAAQQQAMKRSDEVLHKSAEERAQLGHRLELSEQRLQQLADSVSSGLQAVRDEGADRDRAHAARQEERDRREREAAEQRLRRERERDDEHERLQQQQQQRAEQRDRELEAELRKAERALADRLEQATTQHREHITAVSEQLADTRTESRRQGTELAAEIRSLQEQANRRTQEAEQAARTVAQELQQRITLLQQDLTTQVQSAGRLAEEREGALQQREEEQERRAAQRADKLAQQDAELERKLDELTRQGRERDKWQLEAERKEAERERALQGSQRQVQTALGDLGERVDLLTRQTGDDQQATNQTVEMLMELVKTHAETVREDVAADMDQRLAESEERSAEAGKLTKQSDEAARRYAEQLHNTAMSAAQHSDQQTQERLRDLSQRAAALEARMDAARGQAEAAVEQRLAERELRWEERRQQDADRMQSARSREQADAKRVEDRVAECDSKLRSASERLEGLERWREQADQRMRRQQEDAGADRAREGREKGELASLRDQLRAQEDAVQALRKVAARVSDCELQEDAKRARQQLADEIQRQLGALEARLRAGEQQEEVRRASDEGWDQWQSTVNKRLEALQPQDAGAPAGAQQPLDQGRLEHIEKGLADLARSAAAQVEATEQAHREAAELMQEAARHVLESGRDDAVRAEELEGTKTMVITVREELSLLIRELGEKLEEFVRGEEEEGEFSQSPEPGQES